MKEKTLRVEFLTFSPVSIIVSFVAKGLQFFVPRKTWESTVVKDSENGKFSSGRSVERRTRSAAAVSASGYSHFIPFRSNRRCYGEISYS